MNIFLKIFREFDLLLDLNYLRIPRENSLTETHGQDSESNFGKK